MRLRYSSIFMALTVLVLARQAYADAVWMLSGDTLTGTAQTLQNGVLTFRTPYATDIKLPWKEVAGLETARQVRVTVLRKGWHVARVTPGPDGYLRLQTNAGSLLDVPLREVVTIVRPQSGVMTSGRAETGFLSASGTSDVSSLHLTGELMWRTLVQLTTVDLAVRRTQNQGVETTRSITTTLRHREFLNEHLYANGNLALTSDPFRDLALQTAPGLGIGYQFIQSGATNLSLDGGLSYVNERHRLERPSDYWAARETVKSEHFLLPRRLQVFHQHDAYLDLSGDENWFVRTRSGGRVNVMGGIIMTAEFGLDYDRRQAVPERFDRSFAITLGYQRGY
jgi:hypothetical protein